MASLDSSSSLDSSRPFPTPRLPLWLAAWPPVLLAALLLLPAAVRAADVDARALYQKVMGCAECHGADGRTPRNAFTPIIAGQQAWYTVMALKACKAGDRMGGASAQHAEVSDLLNDDQMTALAEYVARMK